MPFRHKTIKMNIDSVREFCLSLPNVTENVQWGDQLLFRVGGRIFAMVSLEPGSGVRLCCKCSPERFAELLEVEGAAPAPYVGRFKWIGLEAFDTLPDPELREVIRESYDLVAAKLPKGKRRARAKRSSKAGRR